ncbi:hypothetical protein LVJ94_26360 [Pendulispora rubella]|uniref:Uncharacterized protein n=1 Tax=Pendulispora rubella TaxID=2741070 RepID=A0ABZ2KT02_9BACT
MTDLPRPLPILTALLPLVFFACSSDKASGSAPTPPDSGQPDAGSGLESATIRTTETPRPDFAGLEVRLVGDRIFVLEVVRDAAETSSRRLAVYARHGADGAAPLWTWAGEPNEFLSDFAVHPSGEITVATENRAGAASQYRLVRLDAHGALRMRAPLPAPTTLPDGSLDGPAATVVRMQSLDFGALAKGWLRVQPRGEDVTLAYLSRAGRSDGTLDPLFHYVTIVEAMRWAGAGYDEAWSRVVDGRHYVDPVGWVYDEFDWMNAALRPVLALDDDGTAIVGRTFSQHRCLSLARTTHEVEESICTTKKASPPEDVEYQPFATTSFSSSGVRGRTNVLAPDGLSEFVVFDMAAHAGQLALAGTLVRTDAEGRRRYYSAGEGAPNNLVPYDGYIGVLDRDTGAVRFETSVDQGRADHFATVRWTNEDIVAAGASDWDRWNGGMSIIRGADPLIALLDPERHTVTARRIPFANDERHFHGLGVDMDTTGIVVVGPADAPMTHSGDGRNFANRTFGGLRLDVRTGAGHEPASP